MSRLRTLLTAAAMLLAGGIASAQTPAEPVVNEAQGLAEWEKVYAVFSHPPIAAVGMTESEARNRLGQVRTFTSDFRPMKNVLAGRNERSLYKLVVDAATDRVVGIHMIGPDAPEILQAAAIAVKAGLKKADFDATIALHPTMSEELVLMR